jgi:hypothetical protein
MLKHELRHRFPPAVSESLQPIFLSAAGRGTLKRELRRRFPLAASELRLQPLFFSRSSSAALLQPLFFSRSSSAALLQPLFWTQPPLGEARPARRIA